MATLLPPPQHLQLSPIGHSLNPRARSEFAARVARMRTAVLQGYAAAGRALARTLRRSGRNAVSNPISGKNEQTL